jgi:ABC-2 type transport system permease protein
MKGLLDVYRAVFKVTVAVQLQYRVVLVIWLLWMVLQPVVSLVVWSSVARSRGGQVGGYGAADFAAYFIVMMLVNHATFTWIMEIFEWRIRVGQFSPMLLRPVHPIHVDIADNITYKALTAVVLVPAAVGLALAFRPALHPAPWSLLALVPALVLAFLLRFVVEWTLALAAFWTTRVAAVNQLYFAVQLFLSGQVAPLSLFPGPVQVLATVLPFRWMVAFPVQLALGQLTPHEALSGYAAQGAWLALGLALLAWTWRRGLRRYAAVGA